MQAEDITLLVSHRERYYNPDKRHVQFVSAVWPALIDALAFNETRTISVELRIPPFVPLGVRSLVTVQAERRTADRDGERTAYERSFFFTVSDRPLAAYDAYEPDCGRVSVCGAVDDAGGVAAAAACAYTDAGNCSDAAWAAEVRGAADNVTGLRHFALAPEHERLNATVRLASPAALAVGNNWGVDLLVEASCCVKGVELRLTDVAGNVAACEVGGVSGAETVRGTNAVLVFAFTTLVAISNLN